MLEGAVAGILFIVWIWLGFKIAERIPNPKEEWEDSHKERFAMLWFASLVTYAPAAVVTLQECGSLGTLLLLWAKISVVAALGLTLAVGGILAIFLAVAWVFLTAAEKAEEIAPDTVASVKEAVNDVNTWRGVLVLAGGLFVAFCAWLGSLPNPRCEAQVLPPPDVADIMAAVADNNPTMAFDFLMEHREEVSALLSEHESDLVSDLDRFLGKGRPE